MRRNWIRWSSAAIVVVGMAAAFQADAFGGRVGYYYRRYSPGHWVYRHTIGDSGPSYQSQPAYPPTGTMAPPVYAAPVYSAPVQVAPSAPTPVYPAPQSSAVPEHEYQPEVPCQSLGRACCAKTSSGSCACTPAVSAPSGQSAPSK